ncbi:hypothetical protein SAMN05877809_1025 [Rhodobacter sp. JA431]|uniref:phage head spike fiber domain-containing protein n=1 Tax=Rhodobacter sp. JA431 TaxID=570013 RepID=UPI000BC4BB74|nr:hypothetical protein [Rhodobacter sp. JA431]SOB97629.1 hypothetical protein SAMN05877809_1025 [Rhodobacter sp. JA431]
MSLQTKSFADLITLSRASTATYVGADGTIKTAAVDVPRFDFSTGKKALLLENSATNFLLHSEAFDNAVWVRQANATVASQDGAWRIGCTDATLRFVTQTPALAGDEVATLSIDIKDIDAGTAMVELVSTIGASGGRFSLSLASGAVTATSIGTPNGSAVVVSVSPPDVDGYRRYVLRSTPGSTGNTSRRVLIGSEGASGTGILVRRPQLEIGAGATSYIPTTTVAVTRAADNIAAIDLSGFYLGDGYTVVVKGQFDAANGLYDRVVQLDGGTDASRQAVIYAAPEAKIYASMYSGGISQGATEAAYLLGDSFAVASALGLNYRQAAINGVAGSLDTDAEFITPNALRLAQSFGGGSKPARLLLESIMIYPYLLTEAQLIEVTA